MDRKTINGGNKTMKFTSFASSSRGNAYLLQAEGAAPLLLEAGLPIGRLRDKLREHGISLSDLGGCLVSHEHMDHAKAVKDLLKAGVDCYMSAGTAKALDVLNHHRIQLFTDKILEWFIPHRWFITKFELEHDAEDPIGFYISSYGEKLLFIPDTSYIKNRFHGITMIAVECNNVSELLSKNILDGHIPAIVGKRVRRSHMSLENLITMLKANDLSRCRAIFLTHLSDGNSDEVRMKLEIQQAVGIPVYICEE
jgi:phosphoribosyl 1,2-cyclic phosphodiesterase